MRVTVGTIVSLLVSGRTNTEILVAYLYLEEEDMLWKVVLLNEQCLELRTAVINVRARQNGLIHYVERLGAELQRVSL